MTREDRTRSADEASVRFTSTGRSVDSRPRVDLASRPVPGEWAGKNKRIIANYITDFHKPYTTICRGHGAKNAAIAHEWNETKRNERTNEQITERTNERTKAVTCQLKFNIRIPCSNRTSNCAHACMHACTHARHACTHSRTHTPFYVTAHVKTRGPCYERGRNAM